MIKLKDILQEKTYKTTLSKSSNWVVYNMSDVLKINPIKVVKSEEEALKWKTKYQRHDKFGAYGAVPVKHWNKYVSAKKLKEYRIRGNADNLLIRKGDIKKGMMVWFEDGKGRAQKLKVKHVMLSKDKKEEHYVTNKGTFTPRDVVAY